MRDTVNTEILRIKLTNSPLSVFLYCSLYQVILIFLPLSYFDMNIEQPIFVVHLGSALTTFDKTYSRYKSQDLSNSQNEQIKPEEGM